MGSIARRQLRKTNVARGVLAILCAMSFILYVDRVNLSVAAGAIKTAFGFSNTTLGVAFSAFGYSYIVFQIVGGWFADRFGPKLTLIICGSIWVCATVATALATGLASLFAARFLLGIGEGGTLPAQARAIANWFPKERRAFVLGLAHSFSRLGNAVTPLLVGFVVAAYSWRASFVVTGVLTALWVVVWAMYFQDDPRRHKRMNAEELATVLSDLEANPDSSERAPVPWKAVLKRMSPTMAVYFCNAWTTILFFTWLPLFFMHTQHLDLMNSAFLTSAVFSTAVLGDISGGVISDQILRRTGNLVAARQSVLVISFLGGLAFLVPLLFATNPRMMAACLAGASFFVELTIGPIWAVPMDVAHEYAGIASGMMNAASAIAGTISPIVFGAVVDWTGNWTLPFAISIGLLMVGMMMVFKIRPDRKVSIVAYKDVFSG